jgi:hypothetical protein
VIEGDRRHFTRYHLAKKASQSTPKASGSRRGEVGLSERLAKSIILGGMYGRLLQSRILNPIFLVSRLGL